MPNVPSRPLPPPFLSGESGELKLPLTLKTYLAFIVFALPFAISFALSFIFSFIYLLYKYIKTRNIKFIYLLSFQLMAYPLFDAYHVIIPFIPAFGYFLDELKLSKKIIQVSFVIFIICIFLIIILFVKIISNKIIFYTFYIFQKFFISCSITFVFFI